MKEVSNTLRIENIQKNSHQQGITVLPKRCHEWNTYSPPSELINPEELPPKNKHGIGSIIYIRPVQRFKGVKQIPL
jgi:hypothetical protein